MENRYPFDEGQFVLSYELLRLLQWLVEHNTDTLKKLVTKAFKEGFGEELTAQRQELYSTDPEILQQAVLDFFALLENTLEARSDANKEITEHLCATCSNEEHQLVHETGSSALASAITSVDSAMYDRDALATSIARAHKAGKKQTMAIAQETLYKELLKNWHHKKHPVQ